MKKYILQLILTKLFSSVNILRVEKNELGEEKDILYLRRITLFKCRWFQIYLNHLFKPFPEIHLFDQPWNSINFVLKGSFIEETPVKWTDNGFAIIQWRYRMATKKRKIGIFSKYTIKAEILRKICVENFKPVLELTVAGPKIRNWGFMEERVWIDHESYYRKYNFLVKKIT